jgi:PAS domain S-box-containing protein
MDYIFFLCGLAFLFLAVICLALRKKDNSGLPWVFLGVFALIHGLNEWLNLLSISPGSRGGFIFFHLFLLTLSFLLLLEFGRSGTKSLKGRAPGRWIYLPLLCFALSGSFLGANGLNAFIRYIIGFTGGMWTSFVFYWGYRKEKAGKRTMIVAACAMFLYALSSGIIVPQTDFFPASFLNNESFFENTGFPIQLLRGILAIIIAVSIWIYFQTFQRIKEDDRNRASHDYYSIIMVVFLFFVLTGGWFATSKMDWHAKRVLRTELRTRANIVSAALPLNKVKGLAGFSEGSSQAGKEELRTLLIKIFKAQKDLRRIYLMSADEKRILLYLDAGSLKLKELHTSSLRLEDIYKNISWSSKDVFGYDYGTVTGPYTDSEGSFVSVIYPVMDPLLKQKYASVVMDVDAFEWNRLVGIYRLVPICVTMVIALILFGFYVVIQHQKEHAERILAAEAALQEQFEFIRTIMETIPSPVFFKDIKGFFQGCNKAFEQLADRPKHEIVGKTLYDLLPGDLAKKDYEMDIRLFNSGGYQTYEIKISYPDNAVHDFIFRKALYKNAEGSLHGIVGILLDITEQKQTEEKLKDSKEAADALNLQLESAVIEAKQASVAKSAFLATMSHEIRTPMNAIIGMADLLYESPLSNEQQQYVSILKSAGDNLLSLINDILDLSKVESGQLTLEISEFDLLEVVEKTCEVIAVQAHKKGIEIACLIQPDVPRYVNGDPFRLRQILINLLGNAVKFTEKGEIVLRVRKPDQNENEAQSKIPINCVQLFQSEITLLFSISDTGIGIPQDKIGVVFERFTQADTSITRQYEGSGLGLTISKQFVEMMGGQIWVKSEVGKGTTFFFTTVFDFSDKTYNNIPIPDIEIKEYRTLVIDDNATNRFILKEMLTRWGVVVTTVKSGAEGLDTLIKAKESGAPFNLVLLDVRMPDMDGFSVAEEIRNNPLLMVDTTVVMLTSECRIGDTNRAKELGISAYLMKPVKQEELKNAIKVALGEKAIAEEKKHDKTSLPEVDQRPLRILLVDDSNDNRMLINAYLKNTPYTVDIAENGMIAVEMFEINVFDLVLMDMQMPVMDGYTATRKIRDWEHRNNRKPTPIIALTAYALKEDMQKSLDAGCDAHLTKPIKKNHLLEKISEYSKKGGA